MSRHIGIAMVAPDMMHTRTAFDLTNMVGYQIGKHRDSVITNRHSGTILSEARQVAAKELLEAGADWVLFVDSDMGFPKDTLERLIAHDEPVVAANCSRRKRPVAPTARKANPDGGESIALWPDPDLHGLDEVETVGTGLMLIRADVFTTIKWPWFNQPWIEKNQKWLGEDSFFCWRCYEAGIPIYIDHDLSWDVRHIGDYEWSMKDVLAERQLDEAGAWAGVE